MTKLSKTEEEIFKKWKMNVLVSPLAKILKIDGFENLLEFINNGLKDAIHEAYEAGDRMSGITIIAKKREESCYEQFTTTQFGDGCICILKKDHTKSHFCDCGNSSDVQAIFKELDKLEVYEFQGAGGEGDWKKVHLKDLIDNSYETIKTKYGIISKK